MTSRKLFSIGLSALALTGVGAAAMSGMAASAASAENPKRAASEAADARKAIAKRNAAKAVKAAEAAVAYDPHNGDYRALLGQAYLLAGRFTSANQALSDALTLDPANGRAALNLALAQIGTGDWAGARHTLDAHADVIPVSDRGLGYALAGDPVKAVEILAPAAREPDATAKTRQNLALSLALSGRWAEAKTVASVDVPPDQLDARIMQWAAFSRPSNAYDQVASLLGVRPVQDGGQPVQLALNASSRSLAAAQQTVDPVDAYMPASSDAKPAAAEAAPVQVAAAEPQPEAAPAVEPAVAGTGPQVVFGPREEIVQHIAAQPATQPVAVAAVAAPAKAAVASRPAPAKPVAASYARGNFYVQLGAFANASIARDAWSRSVRRAPVLAQHQPQGAQVKTKVGTFYRLSVGGFARADAEALCRSVKSGGGSCFVRAAAGDRLASWNHGPQFASR